jgi:hypothetical protein
MFILKEKVMVKKHNNEVTIFKTTTTKTVSA